MTRLLQPDDVPLLLPGAKSFFEEVGYGGVFSPGHFIETWTNGIKAGNLFAVGDFDEKTGELKAVFGGMVGKSELTGDCVVAEAFGYAADDAGIRLRKVFRGFENEARSRGAKQVWFAHTNDEKGLRHARVYEALGYQKKMTSYMKGF